MNTLEDRLRDAYQAAAQTVRPETIRDLHDQAGQPARPALRSASRGYRPASRGYRPASRRTRVLVPLAAAAAVALIAVAASVVIPDNGGGGTTAGPPPRFFLAMPNTETGDHTAVFSATTGRLLAAVTPPRPGSVIGVAAATGNDRTFVVTVQPGSCSTTELYRLRLTRRGRLGALTALAMPKIKGVVTAMAASSDGRMIAYATAFCGKTSASPGAIGVLHTATGQTRQWTWRPNPGQVISSLTITADGRMIEYAASPNKIISRDSGQVLPVRTVRLLPADAPPGNAAQRSRAVVVISRQAPAELFNSAAIAPDGRTLYFCTQRKPYHHLASSALVLRRYDVATAATSVLHTFAWPADYCMLGASGDNLLVGYGTASHPRLARYNVTTGTITPVPVPRHWGESPTNIPW